MKQKWTVQRGQLFLAFFTVESKVAILLFLCVHKKTPTIHYTLLGVWLMALTPPPPAEETTSMI